jgi:hypothetical protein
VQRFADQRRLNQNVPPRPVATGTDGTKDAPA